jgi:hypothetical protein
LRQAVAAASVRRAGRGPQNGFDGAGRFALYVVQIIKAGAASIRWASRRWGAGGGVSAGVSALVAGCGSAVG